MSEKSTSEDGFSYNTARSLFFIIMIVGVILISVTIIKSKDIEYDLSYYILESNSGSRLKDKDSLMKTMYVVNKYAKSNELKDSVKRHLESNFQEKNINYRYDFIINYNQNIYEIRAYGLNDDVRLSLMLHIEGKMQGLIDSLNSNSPTYCPGTSIVNERCGRYISLTKVNYPPDLP